MKDNESLNLEFYRGKRVFLTGHNGFKGSWLSKILINSGAILTGYSLESPLEQSLLQMCNLESKMTSIIGDVRDFDNLLRHFQIAKPEIVFHLAAQPIVRDSYRNPVFTYETNVMGTVNIMECVRLSDCVKSVVNVTTDKVYQNMEWDWGYRENDVLNGYDPYSNSKSCSELVTSSYKQSFLNEAHIAVSTARAGNVIGGGDFAMDRIIPDCVKAAQNKEPVIVRNPNSTRPFQHVLDPLFAYLLIAREQYCEIGNSECYNIGPEDIDCITTGQLVDLFIRSWGDNMSWKNISDGGPHEANFLKLDCSKMKNKFNWAPVWNVEMAVRKTVEWAKTHLANEDVSQCMDRQISEFILKSNKIE